LLVAHFHTHSGVMPRPITFHSELREIRDALSEAEGRLITQEMFAKRLQTSKSYINALEAGSKQMTSKFAYRLLQRFGVICSHPELRPTPDIGKHETSTPFAPRDRTSLANGIRLFLARPKSDGRSTFKHYTMRRLTALVDAAAEKDLGPEVSSDLLEAINGLIREYKLAREYKIALLTRRDEWPPLPDDPLAPHPPLRELVELLYATDDHFPLAPQASRRSSGTSRGSASNTKRPRKA
jgi:hypothetical protein